MPTLLHVLTRPNVDVDSSLVPPGGNTTIDAAIVPENWRPWRGFDYVTLMGIFRRDLDKEYRGSAKHEPLPEDLHISNEETMEDLLRRFETPIVNYCLNGREGDPHFGRGSRCGKAYKPDWSVVSPLRLDESDNFMNVLPGDTKLHTKWWPAMKTNGGNRFLEWQKGVSQAVTYMAYHSSRYGFIITDGCLVALRLTRKPTSPGLAAGRFPRATVRHVRYSSDLSMGGNDSGYQDTNPMHWEYEDPEYYVVPWGAHGSGRLTIKLTLWFMAMMATNGDNFLDYSYPDLNSWRRGEKGYVHNTSGVESLKLSRGDQAQEPNPEQKGWELEGISGAGGLSGAGEKGEEASWVRPTGESEEDLPVFSQTGDASGTGYLPGDASNDEEEEEKAVEANDDDDDGGEEEKEEGGGSSSPQKKSIEVIIQKTKGGKGFYFLDAKKQKKKTSKKEWAQIEGWWMLSGKRHVYFTKKFP
ncbi:hypothetical protein HRG_004031 [Hirsutella rhossiliensis]|uniref:Uncharacterized protein n=1 Tax=Hirsutella rhossiliensis TaxID=111463 RepID=A0A9P8N349_9HYPO|nr:uncharacterized protein HRG_04031 [Hirsutella rhossiliensis]KAH0966015.1 hypothetical protein HRG_04031 [Hirsutella rhossiliensis]